MRRRFHGLTWSWVLAASDAEATGRRSSITQQVDRTLAFLGVAIDDYERAARDWAAANRVVHENVENGPVSLEQWQRMQEAAHLGHMVHLRIETFYANARILLDALVVLIDEIKRPSAVPIGKHTNLDRLLPVAVANGELPEPPDRFVRLIAETTTRVKRFRDRHVSHVRDSRFAKGTTFSTVDPLSTRIGVFEAFPRGTYREESEMPLELWPLLEEYVDAWIVYITAFLDVPEQPPLES